MAIQWISCVRPISIQPTVFPKHNFRFYLYHWVCACLVAHPREASLRAQFCWCICFHARRKTHSSRKIIDAHFVDRKNADIAFLRTDNCHLRCECAGNGVSWGFTCQIYRWISTLIYSYTSLCACVRRIAPPFAFNVVCFYIIQNPSASIGIFLRILRI